MLVYIVRLYYNVRCKKHLKNHECFRGKTRWNLGLV